MPLVDYSSDSSADTPPDTPKPKDNKPAQDLPPLPALFHTLYPTAPRRSTTDDPSLHDNRQRQIPHLPGYYPTHAYLEWYPSVNDLRILRSFINIAASELSINSLLTSALGADLPLHLSLSRPCALARDDRKKFTDILTSSLKTTRKFTVEFTGFEWVVNETASRWFFVLKAKVKNKEDILEDIVKKTNRALAAFNQPSLPCEGFHVSIGWTLQEPTEKTQRTIEDGLRGERYRLAELHMDVEDIRIKIGNVVKRIELH